MSETIAIAGMSLAGVRAAETLRRLGFDGSIVAISREARLPYDRPPLSKEFLAGAREADDLLLRRAGLDELDLDWRPETAATGLDLRRSQLLLDSGAEVHFDRLVIATGAAPRVLPPETCRPGLGGVFSLRTLEDAAMIRASLDDGAKRVCVIGAGFIGAEVAATCRGRGVDVTLLEALPQPMVRGLGPTIGAVCADLHRDHGVDVRLGVQVVAVDGDAKVERVRLGDGTSVDCDVLVVGIGVVPVTDWLADSGLTIDNGVVCDASCLAAPNVVACGDIARWPNPLFGDELMRLEHWTNATEQAVHAATRLLSGEATPFAPVPFVWSDQYDVKMQMVGNFNADDELAVVDGTLGERKFVALFGRGGRLRGALGFSQPRRVMQYRRMISERATWVDALAHAKEG